MLRNPSRGAKYRFCGLERRAILTASLRRASFLCHRQRSRGSPGTLPVPQVKKMLSMPKEKPRNAELFFWQGQKDLNPRHAVLETAALPTELYPYIIYMWWTIRDSNPGPTGYEPAALTN